MRTRRDRGFTLVELVAVVAIIAVLAAVAINYFKKNVRKARSSEVSEVFSKLALGEENFMNETGSYLSTGDESSYFPATLNGNSSQNIGALPATWRQLRADPGKSALYCQYVAIAGAGGTTPGGEGAVLYQGTTPPKNWYYLLARCDWDNNGTDFSQYARRHDIAAIEITNEGK
jgi:prepilin-type N-terminal cleavage/methylation domain-containing protein